MTEYSQFNELMSILILKLEDRLYWVPNYCIFQITMYCLNRTVLSISLKCLALSCCLMTRPAYADTHQDEIFKLDIGAFITERSTDFRIDSKTLGSGTTINAEDDLGLRKNKDVLRTDLAVRLADNHRLILTYYDLSREARRVTDKVIQYGELVLPAGSELNSQFDLEIIKAGYTYSMINSKQTEVGISAGVFVQRYETSIELTANNTIRDTANVTAPLPVIGMRASWKFNQLWQVRGGVDVFMLDYDEYKGRLTDVILALEHNTFENIGFGLAYNSTHFKLEADASNFQGEVNLDYGGLMLYTQVYF